MFEYKYEYERDFFVFILIFNFYAWFMRGTVVNLLSFVRNTFDEKKNAVFFMWRIFIVSQRLHHWINFFFFCISFYPFMDPYTVGYSLCSYCAVPFTRECISLML